MATFENPFRPAALPIRGPSTGPDELGGYRTWWTLASALVAGPLLLCVAKVLDTTGPGMSTATYLEKVSDNRAAYVLAGFFLMAGFLVTAMAAGAVFRLAGILAGKRLLRGGALMLGAGCVLAIPTAAQSFAVGHLLAGDTVPNMAPVAVEAVFSGINSSPWAISFGIGSLLLQAAGFSCLAAGLWKTQLISRPLALLPLTVLLGWAVSGIFQAQAPTWTAAIPDFLLAVTFGAIAAKWPRMRKSR